MEQRVRDTSTRPRRDAYLELLVTVGLFAIPAALNAVYAYVASELPTGRWASAGFSPRGWRRSSC